MKGEKIEKLNNRWWGEKSETKDPSKSKTVVQLDKSSRKDKGEKDEGKKGKKKQKINKKRSKQNEGIKISSHLKKPQVKEDEEEEEEEEVEEKKWEQINPIKEKYCSLLLKKIQFWNPAGPGFLCLALWPVGLWSAFLFFFF